MTRSAIVIALLLAACDARRAVPIEARIVPRDAAARPPCFEPRSAGDDQRCRCASDCEEGAFCADELSSGVPGGACIRFCLADPGACSEGTRCFDEDRSGAPTCHVPCASPDDCPAGRLCSGDGVCVYRCLADADCESGLCDLASGRCHTGELGGGLPSLAPCSRHDECRSRVCLDPYGRCIAPCSVTRQSCPSPEVCVFDGEIVRDQGACLPRCARDADCGDPGVVCDLVARPGATELACVPREWGGR